MCGLTLILRAGELGHFDAAWNFSDGSGPHPRSARPGKIRKAEDIGGDQHHGAVGRVIS
jgi:hypothetical protein